MQTFLTHASFRESAEHLDSSRLRNQAKETMQIMQAILDPTYGWQHHPAINMWRGNESWLLGYQIATCREIKIRGYSDADRLSRTVNIFKSFDGQMGTPMPEWLGRDDFHRSHQSNLLRKAHTMTESVGRIMGMNNDHYDSMFPDVPDDLPYIWPRRVPEVIVK